MVAATLEELSVELHRLAQRFAAQGSRLGYFAALYALMTDRVVEGLASGCFADGARMQQLACHFAARYLAALERFEAGNQTPASWQVAFETAPRWRPIVVQHLMLGVNAHINFDLGIAAAQSAGEGGLAAAQRDFDEINAILAELLTDVQARLARVSPWMGILDVVGGRKDEEIVNFSLRHARDAAWRVASAFSALRPEELSAAEQQLDAQVAKFARKIVWPGLLVSAACVPIRLRETASAAEIIEVLSGATT